MSINPPPFPIPSNRMAQRTGGYRTDGHDSLNDLCALLSQARFAVRRRLSKEKETGVYHRTESYSSFTSHGSSGEYDLGLPCGAPVSEPTTMIPMTRFELPAATESGSLQPSREEDYPDWDARTDDGFEDGYYPIQTCNSLADTSIPPTPARRALRPLPAGTVTLVVRNIPARYSKEMLLEEWIPDGSYNILHLPFNVALERPCGYAFINFVSPEEASKFQVKVHGTYFQVGSRKHLDVSAAEVQGFESTLVLARISRQRQRDCFDEMIPAIFCGEERLSTREVMELLGLKNMKLQSFQRSSQSGKQTWMAHPKEVKVPGPNAGGRFRPRGRVTEW